MAAGISFAWQTTFLACETKDCTTTQVLGVLQTHKLRVKKPKASLFLPSLKHIYRVTDPGPQIADMRASLASCADAEAEQLQYPDTAVGVSLEMLFQKTQFLEDESNIDVSNWALMEGKLHKSHF